CRRRLRAGAGRPRPAAGPGVPAARERRSPGLSLGGSRGPGLRAASDAAAQVDRAGALPRSGPAAPRSRGRGGRPGAGGAAGGDGRRRRAGAPPRRPAQRLPRPPPAAARPPDGGSRPPMSDPSIRATLEALARGIAERHPWWGVRALRPRSGPPGAGLLEARARLRESGQYRRLRLWFRRGTGAAEATALLEPLLL